jgi:signal transduction histidine kinase
MGRIYVERTGSEGTVFVIELPVHRESTESAPAHQT